MIFHKTSFGTHQKTLKKSFSQKGFCSVLNLYAVTTSCKKPQNCMPWLLITRKTPHFQSFLAPKLQDKVIPPKKPFLTILSHDAVTFENFMLWLLIITKEPYFGPISGHVWPQNHKTLFFLSKKTEEFYTLIFYKTWKTSNWTHFGPFRPKNPEAFFKNIGLRHFLNLMTT